MEKPLGTGKMAARATGVRRTGSQRAYSTPACCGIHWRPRARRGGSGVVPVARANGAAGADGANPGESTDGGSGRWRWGNGGYRVVLGVPAVV